MTDTASTAAPLLTIESLGVSFGGVQALDGVSFEIRHRARLGLIGPNGAGKTTLFNCISGLAQYQDGRIRLRDQDLRSTPSHAMLAAGIARTFQNVGLVGELTVLENVSLGALPLRGRGFSGSMLLPPRRASAERALLGRAERTLELLGIAEVADVRCADLPFGTQKRVELARAVMGEPQLLMLDEPANGLTGAEVIELRELLQRLWEESQMTLLVVEHHMGFVMGLCDEIVVLDAGRLLAQGAPDDIRSDQRVIEAYLGRRENEEAKG